MRHFLVGALALGLAISSPSSFAADKDVKIQSYSDEQLLVALKEMVIAKPSAENWDNIAAVLSRNADHERALQAYMRAARLEPNDARIQNLIALEYYNLKDSAKELEHYANAIKIDPQFTDAYINRASTYYDQEKWALAIVDYRTAIGLAPERADIHVWLANTLAGSGAVNAAQTEYRRAVSQDKKSSMAWRAFGEFQRNRMAYKDALKSFGMALALDPNDHIALVGRATTHEKLDRFDQAKRDYEAALKINPDSNSYQSDYGLLLYAYDENTAAITQFDQVIKRDPKYDLAWFNRGLVRKANGHYDRALSDFNGYLALVPDDAETIAQKGDIYRLTGDHLLAIEYLDQAIKLSPGLPNSWRWRSKARAALGDQSGAEADEAQAAKLDTSTK